MSGEQNKGIIRSALQQFNAGNLGAYLKLYAEDAMMYTPAPVPGVTHIKAYYEVFFAAFPDLHIVLDDMVAEADTVAARFTILGTHTGSFMGLAPTGKRINVTGISTLRFVGGKCVERWTLSDATMLMQQLGVVPAA